MGVEYEAVLVVGWEIDVTKFIVDECECPPELDLLSYSPYYECSSYTCSSRLLIL